MSGFLELKVSVIKGGMKLLPVVGPSPLSVNPIFEIGPMEPRYSEYLVFEGVSVDEQVRVWVGGWWWWWLVFSFVNGVLVSVILMVR